MTWIAIPEGDAKTWYTKHKFMPVNHMVVVTEELAREQPDAMAPLERLLEAAQAKLPARADGIYPAPFGKEKNRAGLELLMSYGVQQGLIAEPIPFEQLF